MNSSWLDSVSMLPYNAGAVRTLGCYELLIPLGAGGMASVWLARRNGTRGFQKILAVKLLHARLQTSRTHERMFLDEARIAARIRHPNVAEIYDLGDQDGLLYQAMEWVDGEPLSVLLKACHGKLPIPIAVQIGIQAAAGLHAAHQLRDEDGTPLGLVHRDVSPQNILIGFDGTVKIVDFGVAKARCNAEHTVVGQIKGKVAYMSPEQASALPVDRRTDIFVLGVVLYLMLTGKHPFRSASEAETIRRLVDPRPIAPPSGLCTEIPEALNDVLVEAIHKDSFERCASMADLMRALEAALPPQERLTAEDLGAFMRSRLGTARLHRRHAIREALHALENAAPTQRRALGLPSHPSFSLEQAATPGRMTSNAAMVVTTTRSAQLPAARPVASTILVAGATGLLGGVIGFLALRSVSMEAPGGQGATSTRPLTAEVATPSAALAEEPSTPVEVHPRPPGRPAPCPSVSPARERPPPATPGKPAPEAGGAVDR